MTSSYTGVQAGSTGDDDMSSATPVQVTVTPPTTTSNASGSQPGWLGGKQAEGIVADLHGKYYTATVNQMTFTTSTASAATIPTTLATLASKWCLLNPAGSGRNLEILRFDYMLASATEVVNVIGITKSTQTAAGLGTLTAGIINNCYLGGTASVATYYTAATHADTPVWYKSLLGVDATAVGFFTHTYIVDGAIIVPPGFCIDVVASTGAQANSWVDAVWIEVPL